MTRARQIVVGGLAAKAGLATAIAAALAVGGQAAGRIVHNDGQAMPKGALKAAQGSRRDRRHLKAEAVKELMDMSRRTVVVAHLHPRWLRQAVEDMMDAGAKIDMAAVELLRSQGPVGARQIVEAFALSADFGRPVPPHGSGP